MDCSIVMSLVLNVTPGSMPVQHHESDNKFELIGYIITDVGSNSLVAISGFDVKGNTLRSTSSLDQPCVIA